MSDDVLITPASRKIEFKDSSGNVDGKIELDSAGNLVLTSPGGGIELGDSSSDIFVGNGSANIDIIFEQNGEIRGTTGRTVTLGQSDSNITVDALNFNTSTSTLFKSQNGITSTRLSTTTNGTGGSGQESTSTAPHTLVGSNAGSTQYALLATLPATGNGTFDHIVIEGDMGIWNETHSFRIKMGRRDNFTYDYTLFDHDPTFSRASIVAYQASNGTVTIHAKLHASQYGKVTYTITHAFQATIVDKPSLTTSTPAGTLIFDSNDTSTYPPTMRFPDNQKLEFGAAADLRIYHDGSNSIIEDNGTGSLQLKGAVNINGAYTLPAADGNNAQVLATNGSGTISFQSVGSLAGSGIQNVSDDTSPQLGGNLATAANNIQFGDSSGSTDDRLQFGASQDLQIYHDGSNSFIADGGTGDLVIQATHLRLRSAAAETYFLGTADGSVELYHDNTKKFETSSAGATITGALTTTEGLTVTGGNSGDVLLTFNTDRSWQFQQSGDNATTRLQLKSNVDSKSFDIVNSGGNITHTFFTSSTDPSMTLTAYDADATAGPTINLSRNSASPAVNDLLGNISFKGEDSASNETTYGEITGIITDPTSGSEDGLIRFQALGNGSLHTHYQIGYGGNFFYRDLHLMQNTEIYFEGSTDDNFETHLTVTDPTADRTITLPDATGQVVLSSGAIDTDASAEIGRAHIGYVGWSDLAGFSHVDFNTQTSYSLLQGSTGITYLNAANGQSIKNRINNTTIFQTDVNGLTLYSGKVLSSPTLTLTASGGITFSDGTTQTSAGASTGFSIAMATALG